MNESKISVRYAKAFFTLAVEKNLLDTIREEVVLLLQLWQSQPRFKEILSSPVVKTSEKVQFMDGVFKNQFHPMTIDFFHLLLQNNRETFLKEICLNFLGLHRNYTGIKSAELISAVELDASIIEKFQKMVQQHFGGKAEVETRVDPALIGGYILKIDDNQIDASVSTQLKKMRQELVNVTKIK